VKKGKHTFQVQAIDEAGNVGSPATDTWKRKKKKSGQRHGFTWLASALARLDARTGR
jgi:hypothetical protein